MSQYALNQKRNDEKMMKLNMIHLWMNDVTIQKQTQTKLGSFENTI